MVKQLCSLIPKSDCKLTNVWQLETGSKESPIFRSVSYHRESSASTEAFKVTNSRDFPEKEVGRQLVYYSPTEQQQFKSW